MTGLRLLRWVPRSAIDLARRVTSPGLRARLRRAVGWHEAAAGRIVSARDGRRFHVDADPMYWPLVAYGEFEPEVTRIVRRLLEPGSVAVDIGANFGWYATLFGELVGEGGSVYAFEPVPSTFERLRENLELNDCSGRVVAERAALGAQDGEAEVHLFADSSHTLASLSPLGRDDFEAYPTVVRSLDSFLAERGVERVDLVKCDVEGSELAVFEGARGLLRGAAAPAVLVELNAETSSAFGYQPEDLFDLLARAGYGWFCAVDEHGRLRRRLDGSALGGDRMLLASKSPGTGAALGVD